MTNLFIGLYPELAAARQRELAECLARNCLVFDRVWILAEGYANGYAYLPAVLPANVQVLPVTVRPTFRTFFNGINAISDKINDVNVIANSDIYFEGLPVLPMVHQCFALTRYEVEKSGAIRFLNRNDSQDVWMFRGNVRYPRWCDDWLGVPGIDNRIVCELSRAGYEVTNPSLTIRTFHLHAEPTDHSKAGKRVGPPYLRLTPTA